MSMTALLLPLPRWRQRQFIFYHRRGSGIFQKKGNLKNS
jgi:hypothetical protein